jgi:hypothetical protein
MAITGYFIDKDWNYREVLLGFEHIQGSHTGANLSKVVLRIFDEHGITGRVSSITTDNTSNNETMVQAVQDISQSLTSNGIPVFRIPCLIHMMQLCLRDLLATIKVNPKNSETKSEWSDIRTKSLQATLGQHTKNIAMTLKKVSTFHP